jgi:hypothetical protein
MCPCVMSPFLSLSVMPVSLPDWRLHLKTRHGHLLWCPSHCNVAVSEVHIPPTHTHPPPLPFLSALSTSNTKDQHLFLLLRRNHSFRRIQDSWPPGPFRCPVCVCTCLSVFICALVDLFCPPLTTTTTVLPIPHSVCSSSPYFAKFVSSGNVCGNVHKTASVGLACAKNTP